MNDEYEIPGWYAALDTSYRRPVPAAADNRPQPRQERDCDCPFPWWLLVLGAALGGVGGYYAGRQSKEDS